MVRFIFFQFEFSFRLPGKALTLRRGSAGPPLCLHSQRAVAGNVILAGLLGRPPGPQTSTWLALHSVVTEKRFTLDCHGGFFLGIRGRRPNAMPPVQIRCMGILGGGHKPPPLHPTNPCKFHLPQHRPPPHQRSSATSTCCGCLGGCGRSCGVFCQ